MRKEQAVSELSRHITVLARVYTFLGWLGLLGACLILFNLLAGANVAAFHPESGGLYGISPSLSAFLLICWSILLLNFSKDIVGSRKWSTGLGGICIGILNLFSVPIGTAVGTYTLWILFRHRQLQ